MHHQFWVGEHIFLSNDVQLSVIDAEPHGAIFFFTKTTGLDHALCEALITPWTVMPLTISSIVHHKANGTLLGNCLIGWESPVSMWCLTTSVRPNWVESVANRSLCLLSKSVSISHCSGEIDKASMDTVSTIFWTRASTSPESGISVLTVGGFSLRVGVGLISSKSCRSPKQLSWSYFTVERPRLLATKHTLITIYTDHGWSYLNP